MRPAVDPDAACAEVTALLRNVRPAYGTVTTLLRVMANSPELLRGDLELATALQHRLLPPRGTALQRR